MNDQITFDGAEFDPLGTSAVAVPTPSPVPAPRPVQNESREVDAGIAATAGPPDLSPVAAIRASVVAAHRATIAATDAVARSVLARIVAGLPAATDTHDPTTATSVASGALSSRLELTAVRCFSPLARTDRTDLTSSDIDELERGEIERVFGPAFRQRIDAASRDTNASLHIGAAGHVEAITDLRYAPTGPDFGGCVAQINGDAVAAARTTVEIIGAFFGLHLCLHDSTVQSSVDGVTGIAGAQQLSVRVIEADLVPVPHLRARVTPTGPTGAGTPFDVTTHFVPTTSLVGPAAGGALTTPTGRVGALGTPALLTEFHMAHLARGDQGTAFGPEFAGYTGNRATRLPTGGLLLVDRVTEFDGRRGEWDSGARYRTEYDVPADAWYLSDSANASVPHFVYMETSLQAALLMGYYLGPTLASDETLRLRNLGGTATVSRRVDLRGKTVDQHSTLTSTTIMPGSSLQSFEYSLFADGVEFYAGSTMFGYFSDSALDNQTGLDAGRDHPSWLAREQARTRCRSIDVTARRSQGGELASTDALALVDRIDVVDGGGEFGQGYLHMDRPIDPGDWFFDCHFYLDPVIPGSLGVESVIQCLQEWLVDSGEHRAFTRPEFHIPENVPFSWKYRGQFVPTDGRCELEVHIKTVMRTDGSVVVVADASLWKPGLRIYELVDIAVELREGAIR